jgi:predicted ferric reductase
VRRESAALSLFVAALLFAPASIYGLLLLDSPPDSFFAFSHSLSKLCAFSGLGALVAAALLGARNPLLERLAGLERLLRLHRPLAVTALALCLVHAGLQVTRYSLLFEKSPLSTLADFSALPEMVLGQVALLLLLTLALGALLGIRGVLPFGLWKTGHFAAYLAAPMAFVHGLLRGTDMENSLARGLWTVLLAMFILNLLWRVLTAWGRNRPCTVLSVRQENHDVRSVCLKAISGAQGISWRPGQFVMLRLPGRFGHSEPHPFTISTPPGTGLCCTVKRAGAFTTALHSLEPEARLLVQGSYGVFCREVFETPASHWGFIAGGVGITPFLAVLRHAARQGVTLRGALLWANKREADAFALAELEALGQDLGLTVVCTLTRESWSDAAFSVIQEQGHVDAAMLRRHCRGDERFCLCGPPAMQRFVLRGLRSAFGVRAGAVQREVFSW